MQKFIHSFVDSFIHCLLPTFPLHLYLPPSSGHDQLFCRVLRIKIEAKKVPALMTLIALSLPCL